MYRVTHHNRDGLFKSKSAVDEREARVVLLDMVLHANFPYDWDIFTVEKIKDGE